MIEQIRVTGIVQGVGFRPFVFRLAQEKGLTGEVCNEGQGVLITVAGTKSQIDNLVKDLIKQCPPLATIVSVTRQELKINRLFSDFIIHKSLNTNISTQISPDIATCKSCQEDLINPFSRWYRYPFTNCANCGPHFSLIRTIPDERIHSSMSIFPLCADCHQEYHQPQNKRYHAELLACARCGPKVWLEHKNKNHPNPNIWSTLDDLAKVANLLQLGSIIAIKGIGGFHLLCDATNEPAVARLRNLTKRNNQPLALIARDTNIIKRYCQINQLELELLQSSIAPIVLLDKKPDTESLAPSVSKENLNTLGFMLPCSSLHHLILLNIDHPVVITSGNISNQPTSISNQEARKKLNKIADCILFHNQEIVHRIDDSIIKVIESKPLVLRRSRGFVPTRIPLPLGFEKSPPILAMGSQSKNTFCLLQDQSLILSNHIGDLNNIHTQNAYQKAIESYLKLFKHIPEAIAVDLDPNYIATKLGAEISFSQNIPLYSIQHHHAHIAACLASNQIPLNSDQILGIVLDGLGYGDDQTFWGGEFLLANYHHYHRLASLKPSPMIEYEQAIYQPWRSTYAQLFPNWDHLNNHYGDLELFKFLKQHPLQLLDQLIIQQIKSRLTSSCSTLFEAVAAAIGLCRDQISYENQAAIALEALIKPNSLNHYEETEGYPFIIGKLDNMKQADSRHLPQMPSYHLSLAWNTLLDDLQHQIPLSIISAKFHEGLAQAIVATVKQLRYHQDQEVFKTVALTGEIFQNRILLQRVTYLLTQINLTVLTHSLVPPNDGGLSLGQAVIAAANMMRQ